MGNKRVIWIVLAIAVAFICLGVIGVRTFVQAIYDARGCDWANIDNVEMHAKIDIPSVEGCDCNYTVADNVKRAVFTLDNATDLETYVREQQLKPAAHWPQQLKGMRDLSANGKLMTRTGKHYDSEYVVALEPASRKLWVHIHYKR